MKKDSVVSTDINKPAIIGTFDGECADSNITNKNGLDITHEVWETVFASDEYADGIKNGWFIGYLGHPDDPGCQNFKDGCIIMTDGYINDDGKIHGKFNLIDTPVGRIVKTFIDAGVKFGISVRGAGDIYNNSVDPDTFVFRGFDLVAFPAYPESIPEFTAIAAATDIESQQKYKSICAVVRKNLQSITSAESLDVIQAQFANQSDEYKMIEDRKNELNSCDDIEESEELSIDAQRVEGMTQLYLSTRAELIRANKQLAEVKAMHTKRISRLKKINASLDEEINTLNNHIAIMESSNTRKIKSMERINASQIETIEAELNELRGQHNIVASANKALKKSSVQAKSDTQRIIHANEKLKRENQRLKDSNLIYMQRIEATANDIKEKDTIISDLRAELRETVTATTEIESRTSDLDAQIRSLKQEVSAATKLIQEYQDAYANLYANAIGVRLEDVRVTSATSVKELQTIIGSSKITASTIYGSESELPDIDYISNGDDDSDLVTL